MIKINEVAHPFTWKHVRDAKQYFGYHSDLVDCPIAKLLLDNIPHGEYIVDSRTHMLKPGWLPCIGGWHYDEVKRDAEGKLDWDNNIDKTHYLLILDFGTGSMTQYVNMSIPEIKNYEKLNSLIKVAEEDLCIDIETCDNNSIYMFDCLDAHKGQKATGDGWRYFIRATANTQREYTNEIRYQTQVYIEDEYKGW
jgi:hypothetical protein